MKLTHPAYQNDDAAREYLESLRWPSGPICPHCGAVEGITTLQGKASRPGLYQCNPCHGQFTVTVGTIFEKSKIPLHKWLLAFRLMAGSKKGISAHQIHRTLGITYKSAWFMAHRIREAMGPDGSEPPMGRMDPGGISVEVDDAMLGKRGSPQVLGIAERGGRVSATVVPDTKGATMLPIVKAKVARGTLVYTDRAAAHNALPGYGFPHSSVDHSKKEFVRGDAHTNSIEGFFGVMKRGINGTYQHISAQHTPAYVAEYEFRHNTRIALGFDDSARTDAMLKASVGRRLEYKRLIGRKK